MLYPVCNEDVEPPRLVVYVAQHNLAVRPVVVRDGLVIVCREEEVGFVDLWGSFVGRADMYMKDGIHLSGKGAAVFADKLSAAV